MKHKLSRSLIQTATLSAFVGSMLVILFMLLLVTVGVVTPSIGTTWVFGLGIIFIGLGCVLSEAMDL